MSAPVDPQIALKRRLLRPLPTPGAGKRVRAQKPPQPANTSASNEPAPSETKVESAPNEDNLPTPKASTRDLPLQSEAPTPKLPVIQLNDDPAPLSPAIRASFIVDEAKDAELREKFLKMQIQERPKRAVPKLRIPKKVKPPPMPMQRRMARVKPTVKTAPRPEISFGPTITAFGESETGESGKGVTDNKPEAPRVNLQALKRRHDREKKERLGIARSRPRLAALPDTAEDKDEDSEDTKSHKKLRPANKEEGGGADSSEEETDDIEERKRKSREKMKNVTLMMARDIQKWRIPKSKLKEMAKGKTEQETAARKRVLEMAWKIAKRQQEKQKLETEERVDSVDQGSTDTPDATNEPKAGEGREEGDDKTENSEITDERKTSKSGQKLRNAKGKQKAPGWSTTAATEPPT